MSQYQRVRFPITHTSSYRDRLHENKYMLHPETRQTVIDANSQERRGTILF